MQSWLLFAARGKQKGSMFQNESHSYKNIRKNKAKEE